MAGARQSVTVRPSITTAAGKGGSAASPSPAYGVRATFCGTSHIIATVIEGLTALVQRGGASGSGSGGGADAAVSIGVGG